MYWSVPQVVKKLVTRYFPNLDSIKVYSKDSDANLQGILSILPKNRDEEDAQTAEA